MPIRIYIDQGHNPYGFNAGAEGFGLRERLPVRARRKGKADRHAVPARFPFGERILRAYGRGSGRKVQSAPERDQKLEKRARRKKETLI